MQSEGFFLGFYVKRQRVLVFLPSEGKERTNVNPRQIFFRDVFVSFAVNSASCDGLNGCLINSTTVYCMVYYAMKIEIRLAVEHIIGSTSLGTHLF